MTANEREATCHVAGPFAALDHRWSVSCDDARLADLLADLFAPLLDASGPSRVTTAFSLRVPREGSLGSVHRDDRLLGRESSPAALLGRLIWGINQHVIDGSAERHLLLHAAAAADRAGRVVLLPAAMEAGKTTLVTGLLDRGLGYLTDEAAAVRPDLSVRGYGKPLSVDPGSWDLLRHHEPDLPEELGPYMARQWQVPVHRFTTVLHHGPLAVIVFPSYEPDEATRVDELTPIDALDLARASTFGTNGEQLPTEKLASLAAIVTQVPCYRLVSGDLDQACQAVLGALDAHT